MSPLSSMRRRLNSDFRIPALWNGIYGLRPSVGRLPHSGLQGPHDGMDMIMGVVGPLATCVEDLSLFCSAVLAQQPWLLEAQNICKPWEAIKSRNPLTIGVMYDDGLCAPHPPISGALEEAVKRLRACGHKIVVWDPISAKESEEILVSVAYLANLENLMYHSSLRYFKIKARSIANISLPETNLRFQF